MCDEKKEQYFVLGGVNITIKLKRGKEPYLREECENEPILFFSPYIYSSCPYSNSRLVISGFRDLKKLKEAIEWAINR